MGIRPAQLTTCVGLAEESCKSLKKDATQSGEHNRDFSGQCQTYHNISRPHTELVAVNSNPLTQQPSTEISSNSHKFRHPRDPKQNSSPKLHSTTFPALLPPPNPHKTPHAKPLLPPAQTHIYPSRFLSQESTPAKSLLIFHHSLHISNRRAAGA